MYLPQRSREKFTCPLRKKNSSECTYIDPSINYAIRVVVALSSWRPVGLRLLRVCPSLGRWLTPLTSWLCIAAYIPTIKVRVIKHWTYQYILKELGAYISARALY